MSRFCPNCGSEEGPTARFCSGCGFVLPPVPTQAPVGLQEGPAPPGSGAPAPAPAPSAALAAASSAAAASAFPAPGPHRIAPPPPAHGAPAKVVAIAGAVAVAAGIAALVVFLTAGHGPRPRSPSTPSPSQPPPPPPSPSPGTGTRGSLAAAFPSSVAGFTLDQPSLQQDPILISDGAADSLEATYSDASGTQVLADLGGFGSARAARKEVLAVARHFSRHGFSVASPQPLTDNRGTQIGVFVTVDGSTLGQPDHVIESNNNLYEEFVGSDFSTLAEFSRSFP